MKRGRWRIRYVENAAIIMKYDTDSVCVWSACSAQSLSARWYIAPCKHIVITVQEPWLQTKIKKNRGCGGRKKGRGCEMIPISRILPAGGRYAITWLQPKVISSHGINCLRPPKSRGLIISCNCGCRELLHPQQEFATGELLGAPPQIGKLIGTQRFLITAHQNII